MEIEEEELEISMGLSSEIEEILDPVDLTFKSLQPFGVELLPSNDHHFLSKSKADLKTRLGERMKREREILVEALPNSIYVRAYEGRKDIMRAVVIALEGSSRSYGLFFFDIFIPEDYPLKPPHIFLHPYHRLLNMNMSLSYDCNGGNNKVIKNAVSSWWDSQTSNIFSMLGFIQREVIMKSRIYAKDDEKEFLFAHQAMLWFLTYPPKGFESFVRGYFRKYSHNILMKFKGEGSSDEKSEIFGMLFSAFKRNGSYCEHLVHILESEEGLRSPSSTKLSTKTALAGVVSWFCNFRW